MGYGETLTRPFNTGEQNRREKVIPQITNTVRLREYLRDDAWEIMTMEPLPSTSGQWERKANCNDADPELFFPGKGSSPNEARKLCLGCAVRDVCLVDAMTKGDFFAVRGGLVDRERRALKKQLEKYAEERRAEAEQLKTGDQ